MACPVRSSEVGVQLMRFPVCGTPMGTVWKIEEHDSLEQWGGLLLMDGVLLSYWNFLPFVGNNRWLVKIVEVSSWQQFFDGLLQVRDGNAFQAVPVGGKK